MGFGSGWGTGWGGGGGEEPDPPPNSFVSPLYPVPFGVVLGSIPLGRFTGEPQTGPLSGANGAIFFSPSFLQQNNTNEIDLDNIRVSVRTSDEYVRPIEEESRVFTFGPTGSSKTNTYLYKSQPAFYAVTAILVQTIPPGPTTVIKIP